MKPEVHAVGSADMAQILGVTPERVRQLVHEGLPQMSRSGRNVYNPPDVIRWLRARDVEMAKRANAANGAPIEAEEKALKMKAERELKELELAQLRRELVPMDEFRTVVDKLVGGFASVALGRLQQFERRIVQAQTAADARRITQAITGALMQGAQDYGDTMEPDETEAAA